MLNSEQATSNNYPDERIKKIKTIFKIHHCCISVAITHKRMFTSMFSLQALYICSSAVMVHPITEAGGSFKLRTER